MAVRVALIGASGIGKHHGNWWTLEGAEVRAFAGTSRNSVAKTRRALEDLFGFTGSAYTDVPAMLEKERPDWIDVCSPPPEHAEHVRMALEAGCHVLCEKPFVYEPGRGPQELLAQARALVALAAERNRELALCAQYAAGARLFRELFEDARGNAPLDTLYGHLEAPAKGRGPDPRRIWADLSPHLISVLFALAPEAQPQWDTLDTRFDGYEAEAALTVSVPGGRAIACRFFTRDRTEPPSNVRRVELNGYRFDIEGAKDAQGVYCADTATPDGTTRTPDFMRLLIRDALAGHPTVTGDGILRNLDLMLRILSAART